MINMKKTKVKSMATSTNWVAFPQDGCFYRLEDGVLLQAPMNADNTMDSGSIAEVDLEQFADDATKTLRQLEKAR
jgi:hypothetical protein